MSLFQHTILKTQITDKISRAYKLYADYFHHPTIQENIRNSKEEQVLTELAKQKVTLSFKQWDEWEEYYKEEN
jgi:hypothetical protein